MDCRLLCTENYLLLVNNLGKDNALSAAFHLSLHLVLLTCWRSWTRPGALSQEEVRRIKLGLVREREDSKLHYLMEVLHKIIFTLIFHLKMSELLDFGVLNH